MLDSVAAVELGVPADEIVNFLLRITLTGIGGADSKNARADGNCVFS